MTTYTTYFDSRDKVSVVMSWTKIMTSQLLFQKMLEELEIMCKNAIYICTS